MQRAWANPMGGFVAFPETKTGEQIRAIGPEAIKVIVAQPQIAGNPYVFAATTGDGPFTSETNRPSKSLHRMLSEKGNPSMDNLAAIFGAVRNRLGVAIEARAVETA